MTAGVIPCEALKLPEAVAAMIREAVRSGDPKVLAAVIGIARRTNPGCDKAIEALVASPPKPGNPVAVLHAPPALAAAPGPKGPPRWKGALEFGGHLNTGGAQVAGANGGVDLTLRLGTWRNRFLARGDYQSAGGRTTSEQLNLSYQPRLDLTNGRYAFGVAQYDHDPSQGYLQRYTVGIGLGFEATTHPKVKIGLDFGPAFRVTHNADGGDEQAPAVRGSFDLHWLLTRRLTFSEESAVYADHGQATASSITGIDTVLFGPLRARLSYNLDYEHSRALGRISVKTTTRASLLYSF
ncbi:MAG: DUF481 domain-containing protein [Phenylobacterium sp.]